jgi:hypothetical protein
MIRDAQTTQSVATKSDNSFCRRISVSELTLSRAAQQTTLKFGEIPHQSGLMRYETPNVLWFDIVARAAVSEVFDRAFLSGRKYSHPNRPTLAICERGECDFEPRVMRTRTIRFATMHERRKTSQSNSLS